MPDMSLLGFMGLLARAPLQIANATHSGLERAARIIENEAKAEIGVYQSAAGPFAAWPALADATKADRVRMGYPADEPLLREGDLRESIGHAVHGNEAVVGSDSPIALYQELGTSRIPPRSFLGGAAFRKAGEVAEEIGRSAVMSLVGGGQKIDIK